MTGRHLRTVGRHGIYDDPDDPGPAPDSVPACPICGVGQAPDVIAIDKPPGFTCRRCGWWIPPEGGRVDKKRRDIWESGRPTEPEERTSE